LPDIAERFDVQFCPLMQQFTFLGRLQPKNRFKFFVKSSFAV